MNYFRFRYMVNDIWIIKAADAKADAIAFYCLYASRYRLKIKLYNGARMSVFEVNYLVSCIETDTVISKK